MEGPLATRHGIEGERSLGAEAMQALSIQGGHRSLRSRFVRAPLRYRYPPSFFGFSAAIIALAEARSMCAKPANSWPEKSASPPSMVTRSPVWYGLASLIR